MLRAFFTEFSTYLETILLSKEHLVIAGDFNIHVDVPHDPDSVKLPDLLQTVGLQQHIAEPTQIQGHTLDFLIPRSCDDVLNKANLVDRFISDHAFVYCALLQDRPAAVTTKSIAYRMPKAVDVKSIRRDLSDSLLCSDPPYMQVQLHSEDPRDLDALVRRYNTTRKTKTVKVSPAVPWYNNEIKAAKRLRRKAQGTWRRTRSLSDLNIFNPYRNRVTFLMNHTRQAFYTNFIDENSTDHKRLFRATKYFLAKKEELSFPNYQDKSKLANDIGVFFIRKTDRIRSHVDAVDIDQSVHNALPPDREVDAEHTFHSFQPLSENDVSVLIRKSAKKS